MSKRRPLITIIVILFVILSYFITFDDAHKERERIIDKNLNLTANISKDLDIFISNCFLLTEILSGVDDVDYIAQVLERNPNISSFLILDTHGDIVHDFHKELSKNEQEIFLNLNIRPYLQYPLQGERYVSNVVYWGYSSQSSIDQGEEVIVLGSPVFSDGKITRMAFLTIKTSIINPILDNYKIGENGYIIIRDGMGNIIYHPSYEKIRTRSNKFLDIPLIPRSDNKIQRSSPDNKMNYITYQPMEEAPWMVFVMQPYSEYQSPVILIWIKNGTLLILLGVFVYLFYTLEKKDKRLLETQLTNEKLEVAAQVAAGLAHEIKNPLVPIKGFIQLEKLKSDSTLGQQNIKLLLNEIKRIENIINNFMTLARSSSDRKDTIVVLDLLQDVLTLMQVEAGRKGIGLVSNISKFQEKVVVKGNGDHLTQVFQNIIKNALEAEKKGGLVEVQIKKEKKEVRISIKDTGLGMSAEQLRKIGTPFYSTKEQGTGLGLATCHRLVKNHGGSINILSQEGKGTTVEVILPTI